ncbi:hypothetical protein ACIGXM_28525 [Kitasatospora sp. NPDC052896]|uniref:WXG100-like domain-containing protein n=1 Tax=Kitasatospora sp. NPDC052896 TaxID=3364061 RepID=UPI0037C827EB
MSIELPPALSWVASLAAGSHWPKGDEDAMAAVAEAWEDAERRLIELTEQIGDAGRAVLAHIGGQVADMFKQFTQSLESSTPDIGGAAGQLAQAARNTGVQLQHAKLMILAQLVWLANEIADLSFWAPEAIPAAVTSARVAITMIARRLLTSIAAGAAFMAGMDFGIQAIQHLMHDRTTWDWSSVASSAESGAIGGGTGGGIGAGAGAISKKAANSLIGKAVIGGAGGMAGSTVLSGIFGGPNDFALAGAGGAISGALGGGKGRGGGGAKPSVGPIDVHLPPGLHLPEGADNPSGFGVKEPGGLGTHGPDGFGANGTGGLGEHEPGSDRSAGSGGSQPDSAGPADNPAVTTGQDARTGPTDDHAVPFGSSAPPATGGAFDSSPENTTVRTASDDPAPQLPTEPEAASPAEPSQTPSGLAGFETTLTGDRPATGSTSRSEQPAPEVPSTATVAGPPARQTTRSGSVPSWSSTWLGGAAVAPRAPGWHEADGEAAATPTEPHAPISTSARPPATQASAPPASTAPAAPPVSHSATPTAPAPHNGNTGAAPTESHSTAPSAAASPGRTPVTHAQDAPGEPARQAPPTRSAPLAHSAEPQPAPHEPAVEPTAPAPGQASAHTQEPARNTQPTSTPVAACPGPGESAATPSPAGAPARPQEPAQAGAGRTTTPDPTAQPAQPARPRPTGAPVTPTRPSLNNGTTGSPGTASAHTTGPDTEIGTPAAAHRSVSPSTVAPPPEAAAQAPHPAPAAPPHEPATAQAPVTPTDPTTRPADPTTTPPPAGPGGQGPVGSRPTRNPAPRFFVSSGFDQRRFTFGGTAYTDLTVRVAFQGGSPKDVADTVTSVQQGVQQHFNDPNHQLPNRDRLHVTVEPVGPEGKPHLTVQLTDRNGPMDQRAWPVGAPPARYAHEIAHQLGLRDESQDPSNPNRADVPGSLLGDFRKPPTDPGLDQGGLRDRHLLLLGALTAGHDDPRHPPGEPPVRAPGAHPAEVGHAPGDAAPKPSDATTPHDQPPRQLPEASAASGAGASGAAGPERGAGTTVAPASDGTTGPRPVEDDPGWQRARAQARSTSHQHTWVDPVSDPTRTRYPRTAPTQERAPVLESPYPAPAAQGSTSHPAPQGPAQQHHPAAAQNPNHRNQAPQDRPQPQTTAAQESTSHEPTQQHQQPAAQNSRTPAPHDTAARTTPQEPTQQPAAHQTTPQGPTHQNNQQPTAHDTPPQEPAQQHQPSTAQETTQQNRTQHQPAPPPTTHPEPTQSQPTQPRQTVQPAAMPPPATVDERHTRSLAGLKITGEPGPEAVRSRINELLGDHRNERSVVLGLDSQLTPGNFRTRHPQMADGGGWRFPITVKGRPYEVQLSVQPHAWEPTQHVPTKEQSENDGKTDIESTAKSSYTPEPRKTQANYTQSGLSIAPSYTHPVNPHLLATVSPSVTVGGANHEIETTVTSTTETSNKLTLTGPTAPHIARFDYHVDVVDNEGESLGGGKRPPVVASVTAEIPHRGAPEGTTPQNWEGWDPAPRGAADHAPAPRPGAHPHGQPLTVTGLGEARDAVFNALPKEKHPDGAAHQAINDFFTQENVVNEFEHASSWGMTSPPVRFSDGSTGHLHLTLEPHGSTVLDTVDHKVELGSNTSTEHKGSQADKTSRGFGLGAGATGQVWKSPHPGDKESRWLGGSGGYSYSGSHDREDKSSHTVKVANSHEHKGKADIVATDVHFHITVTKQHFSPGADGLHNTKDQRIGARVDRSEPPAEPHDGDIVITIDHPITGQALRVVPHPPTEAAPTDAGTLDQAPAHATAGSSSATPTPTNHPPTHIPIEPLGGPGTEHPARTGEHSAQTGQHPTQAGSRSVHADPPPALTQPAPPPAPDAAGLRSPLDSHRTSYLRVPGSAELEQHIVTELHRQAPGLLPPPRGAAASPGADHARVTPQAIKNLDDLHQQITPSALVRGGPDLIDGAFRITLDSSHLPGFGAKTHEILIKADLGPGAHTGSRTSTTKNSISRTPGGDHVSTDGGKHTVSGSINLRASENHPDTNRAFVNFNADGSYGTSHQSTTAASTETKHEFSLEGPADQFDYPATYHVMIGREDPKNPTTVLNTGAGSPHAGQTRTVQPNSGQLRVEQHPPAPPSDTPPPQHPAPASLPQANFIRHVDNQPGFQRSVDQALRSAFNQRPGLPESVRRGVLGDAAPSDLSEVVDALSGPGQLRGAVHASHGGWANTGDEHVGWLLDQGTVGLSTRTRLSDFHYQETLSGEGKLTIESTSKTSTAVEDKWSGGLKGGAGPDFGKFPETPQNTHESTYQVRGGFKVKGNHSRSGGDAVKHEASTTRTFATPKGTWHVYQAKADITTIGRVTDNKGATSYGDPQRSEHTVQVLLSDGDVRALDGGAEHPEPSDPRTATLLNQGIGGSAFAHLPGSDEILTEIDKQLRGPQPEGAVPEAALPFADTYSPHNLGANFDDLMGKGILGSHVDESRFNRVVTTALVRGVPGADWHDDQVESDGEISREVTSSRTVTGSSGRSSSLGADVNGRFSLRTPQTFRHLNNFGWNPSSGGEANLTTSAKSGMKTEISHKTSGFGTNHKFSNNVRFQVSVSRNINGRFANLKADPAPVNPSWRTETWVPEPLTVKPGAEHDPPAVRPAPGEQPHAPQPQAPQPAGGAAGSHPGDGIALQPVGPHGADVSNWRQQLADGHDMVGFSNSSRLADNAVHALNTPRPWGDGVVGRTGAAVSTAIGAGAGLLGSAASKTAHAVLPQSAYNTVHRFHQSHSHDPRLPDGDQLKQEQPLPAAQQAAVRQVFSPQSLPAVFHELNTPGSAYHTVPLSTDGRTHLVVRMDPTGPAQEFNSREKGKDELTSKAEDASSTSATKGYTWSGNPADLSVLTNKPLVNIPFSPVSLAGQGSGDRTTPVTHAPEVPSRPLPVGGIPHGKEPTEAGKAELKGPQALMSQPVRFTTQKADRNGPYGEAVPTDGDLYYWSEKRPDPDSAPTAAPADAPAGTSGAVPAPATGGSGATPPATARPTAAAPATGNPATAPASTTGDSGTPPTTTRPATTSEPATAPATSNNTTAPTSTTTKATPTAPATSSPPNAPEAADNTTAPPPSAPKNPAPTSAAPTVHQPPAAPPETHTTDTTTTPATANGPAKPPITVDTGPHPGPTPAAPSARQAPSDAASEVSSLHGSILSDLSQLSPVSPVSTGPHDPFGSRVSILGSLTTPAAPQHSSSPEPPATDGSVFVPAPAVLSPGQFAAVESPPARIAGPEPAAAPTGGRPLRVTVTGRGGGTEDGESNSGQSPQLGADRAQPVTDAEGTAPAGHPAEPELPADGPILLASGGLTIAPVPLTRGPSPAGANHAVVTLPPPTPQHPAPPPPEAPATPDPTRP